MVGRRCTVLHQAIPRDAPPDEQEVLLTAAAVQAALQAGGWDASVLEMTPDLAACRMALQQHAPDLVFNLVDSLDGADALATAAPALLQHLRLPFTGAPLAAIALSADKLAVRAALRAAGIAVAPGPDEGWQGQFIVKDRSAHASAGMGRHSVVDRADAVPPGHFAEAFIEGREFNVSILHGEAFPPAELAFVDWPEDRPRMLDYEAKWDEASLAFDHTERRFGVAPDLAGRLAAVAKAAWRALGLEGYARIDFRVAGDGAAYVIDVNPNPCLDPDSGFPAAAAEAGLDYAALVQAIAQPPSPPSPARRDNTPPSLALRDTLRASDDIEDLCRETGFFTPDELAIARELAADRLAEGTASHYRFVLADGAAGLCGYACFGRIQGTQSGWDLYWIVVRPAAQGAGAGRTLLHAVRAAVAAEGGGQIYAETSGTPLYAPTRGFYAASGFVLQASVPDFYAPGDAKLIWMLPARPDTGN